jgi:hypothetical protein
VTDLHVTLVCVEYREHGKSLPPFSGTSICEDSWLITLS